MKINIKVLAICLAAAATMSLYASCSSRTNESGSEIEDPSSEIESTAESFDHNAYTPEEASRINASIAASDINLVQLRGPEVGSQVAIVNTTMGDLEIILFPDQAPKAVENFITHSKEGYYNGQIFDKVIKNFIIEGGDPDGSGGKSIYNDESGDPTYFDIEPSLDLWHFRGAVSMSIMDGQDGNGSKFFIVQAPYVDDETAEYMKKVGYPQKVLDQYLNAGGTPGFDSKRTVFGMLTDSSLKVLDGIASVAADPDGYPDETIIIESITIKTFTSQDVANEKAKEEALESSSTESES